MEEAYTELYKEFLHLRSICMRQAALLQSISKALPKQQGSDGYSADGLQSIPVQCSKRSPARIHEWLEPLLPIEHSSSPQIGTEHLTGGSGTCSDLLVEGMVKLGLEVPHRREENPKAPSMVWCSPVVNGETACPYISPNPRHSDEKRTMQPFGMPWAVSPLLDSGELSPTSGVFMSELELQSQVCEFCQAAFPGHTTTRGEFLRHLHTHIT